MAKEVIEIICCFFTANFFPPALLPSYINGVTVLHRDRAAAVLLFCCFDPAPFEEFSHSTSCYPGCFSGGPHAK